MSDLNPNFTDVHVKGVYDIMKCLSEEVVFEIKDSVTKKTVSVSSAEGIILFLFLKFVFIIEKKKTTSAC